jgi:hypothetical protein
LRKGLRNLRMRQLDQANFLDNAASATGGPIADGHYVLTEGRTDDSAYNTALEIWVRGGRLEWQGETRGVRTFVGGALSTKRKTMTVKADCNSDAASLNAAISSQYSATSSQLQLKTRSGSGHIYILTLNLVP